MSGDTGFQPNSTDHEELPHEEHEIGEELWLISYSDLMTLLFGFFVLMYSISKSTSSKQQEVKETIAKTFTGTYISTNSELAKELKDLAKKTQESELMGQIEVTEPKDGLEITFRSNLLFSSGDSQLRPEVQTVMKQLVAIILKSVRDAEIMVAGHTDDVPIKTERFPSNWELSASRAATVVKEFEQNGYRSELLVAMGYGSSRPSFPNRSRDGTPLPANREKNRRVVIKVVSPGVVKQPSPSQQANTAPTDSSTLKATPINVETNRRPATPEGLAPVENPAGDRK